MRVLHFLAWAPLIVGLAFGCAGSSEDSGPPGSSGSGGQSGDGSAGTGGGVDTDGNFPNCSDGTLDGTETDVDCGGGCSPCSDKKKCSVASDCSSKICVGGMCGGCNANAPCPQSMACVAGYCQPCKTNSECGAGQACVSGKCGSCGGGSACDPGQACVNGTCGPCSKNSDCGGGRVCSNGACGPCADASSCDPGQICASGACGPCASGDDCPSGQACVSGKCGPCTESADCGTGKVCVSGACGACTASSQCGTGQVCVSGACTACTLSSQCDSGQVCESGKCLAGSLVQMYQCPGVTSLGGGAWGFYGCQSQITNTATCNEIESPTSKNFNCTADGKMALVTATDAAPGGAQRVQMYQCPGVTSLGGGSWGFYGCQNQITNTSSCNEIEFPTTKNFSCSPVGKLTLWSTLPTAPPGGQVIQMYQCPGVTSLGGGSWGFYGCQGQLTNTPTCNEIEYPTSKNFNCTAAGWMVLEP